MFVATCEGARVRGCASAQVGGEFRRVGSTLAGGEGSRDRLLEACWEGDPCCFKPRPNVSVELVRRGAGFDSAGARQAMDVIHAHAFQGSEKAGGQGVVRLG